MDKETSSSEDKSNSSFSSSILTDNFEYVPDTSRIHDSLKYLLSPDIPATLLDVSLRCSDGKIIDCNKTLLVLRSPFFNKLFCSSFIESKSNATDIPFASGTVRKVIQYILTADVTLVQSVLRTIRRLGRPSTSIPDDLREQVTCLVDLGVAADYIQLPHLQDLVSETLSETFFAAAPLGVDILNAVVKHNDAALYNCDISQMCHWATRNFEKYFGVRDTRRHPRLFVPRPVAVNLSVDSLRFLLGIDNRDYSYNGENGMRLFQVLFAWASVEEQASSHCSKTEPSGALVIDIVSNEFSSCAENGGDASNREGGTNIQISSDGNSELDTSNQTANSKNEEINPKNHTNITTVIQKIKSRWEIGCNFTKAFDFTTFTRSFLLDFVENSRLVSQGVLLEAYRMAVAESAKCEEKWYPPNE